MQCKVLDAFTFNDGTYVPAGNKVSVAQQAMMVDPASFQGFRFANGNGGTPSSTSRLSHPSTDSALWGSVRYPWYETAILQSQYMLRY